MSITKNVFRFFIKNDIENDNCAVCNLRFDVPKC